MTPNCVLERRESKPSLNFVVLGVCSGTVMSNMDCVVLHYRQDDPKKPFSMRVVQYDGIAIPLRVQLPILNLLRTHPKNPHAMLRAQNMLGHLVSSTIKCFCSNHKISIDSIDLVAVQVDSIPPSVLPSTGAYWTSETNPALQSWTAVIAAETDIITTTNLPKIRKPLNPHDPTAGASFDSLVLQHATKFRVCVTIHDSVNISIIPPESTAAKAQPWEDCGPGTVLIDYAMQYTTSNEVEHDYDGSYSTHGTINYSVVDRFLDTHDYIQHKPSMSTTIEMLGHHEAQDLIDECLSLGMSGYDIIATITRITAQNISRQYNRLLSDFFPPEQKVDELFFCGPGAHNLAIVDYLETVLPDDIITRPLDDIGIPGDAKGAVCCAQVGLETMLRCVNLSDEQLRQEEVGLLPGSFVAGTKWAGIKAEIKRFWKDEKIPAVSKVAIEYDAMR